MAMIVWYLNHYATLPELGNPGRPYHLARSFQVHGHPVLVVCASHHHLSQAPVETAHWNRVSAHEGVEYYCISTRPYRGNNLGRLLNMLDYARGIRRLAREVDSGRLDTPDVIIPSCAHIFAHPPARCLARRFNAALIYEVRDLWPLSLVKIMHLSALHPLVVWMSLIERRAYRQCDAVVSLLPRAVDYMKNRGLDPARFHWVPNGVWADEWAGRPAPLPQEHRDVFDRIRQSGKLTVLYVGAHGPPNALDQICDLCRVNRRDRPYHFVLIGDGVSKADLESRARRQEIDFMTFLPRLDRSAARSALLQADVCFIGWKRNAIYAYGISPNKIGDYFMAGKPVLHAVEAGNDPVTEADAGISVEPYHPVQLDLALRRLAAMGREEREAMGARGRDFALRNLDWSILGKKYATLCEDVRQARKGQASRCADSRE